MFGDTLTTFYTFIYNNPRGGGVKVETHPLYSAPLGGKREDFSEDGPVGGGEGGF